MHLFNLPQSTLKIIIEIMHTKATKNKNKQVGLCQTKMLLQKKGNYQQMEKQTAEGKKHLPVINLIQG